MRTKFTSTASDGSTVTHYRNEGAGGPTSTTYQHTDQHTFAFPARLTGAKILKIAESLSYQDISEKVSEARVTADGPLLSGAAVASRIRAALKIEATEIGKTLREAQTDFAAIRKSNGIKVHVPGYTRMSSKAKSAAKSASTGKEASVKKSMEEKNDAFSSDSELSELETDTEQ